MTNSRISRLLRGSLSILGVVLHPLGRFTGRLLNDLHTPDRLEHGLILVLPGIEGESCLNHSIARGLADGGVRSAIEVFDWTTGVILLAHYHLRGWRRNVRKAGRLVRRIIDYQTAFPGRPVHLVGHSGGGAMTVLALERLPPGASVTSAILLQAAISPGYDLSAALEHTEQGIWNFCSLLDLFFVGIGTSVAGTLDGRHTLAAGMVGFRLPVELNAAARELYRQRLHEVPFRLAMMADFHFGGHFGPSNRVFAARHLATLLGERKPCQ